MEAMVQDSTASALQGKLMIGSKRADE